MTIDLLRVVIQVKFFLSFKKSILQSQQQKSLKICKLQKELFELW